MQWYDVPSAPVTFTGTLSPAPMPGLSASTSQMDYAAPHTGQYVADISVDQGGALTWSGYIPITTSQQLAIGTIDGGPWVFSLADAANGVTTYSITLHELPVVISGLTFGYASVQAPGLIVAEYSISGDTTITAFIRNASGQIVRHLGSFDATYYSGAGTTEGTGPSIFWDLLGDGGVALPTGTYYLHLDSTDPNGNVTSAETSIVLEQQATPPAPAPPKPAVKLYRVPILRGKTLVS